MTVRPLALVSLLALGLCGCHRAYKPAPNPVEIDPAEYDRIFAAAVTTLRDHGFTVDRQDYRFGKVTTEPLASPTVFEPWLHHNTTLGQAAQSTLDHLRRTVTVSLEPVSAEEVAAIDAVEQSLEGESPAAPGAGAGAAAAEEGSETPEPGLAPPYRLRVEVLLENQQVPTRRLNGSVTGSRFSALSAVPAEWESRNIAPAYWQPIGRDAHLEQRLARRIVERSMQLPE